jgi:hypothetical protein
MPPRPSRRARRSAAQRRSIAADLRWGVLRGLGFAGIISALAALAGLAAGEEGRATLATPLGQMLAWYLGVGAIGGALAGLGRPLLRTGGGAAVLGAVVGALGLGSLVYLGEPGGAPRPAVVRIGAALGVGVGAFLGWWMWRRERAWRRSIPHDT